MKILFTLKCLIAEGLENARGLETLEESNKRGIDKNALKSKIVLL